MTNHERAEWAKKGVREHQGFVGMKNPPEISTMCITHFLCDLSHLCDELGIGYQHCAQVAQGLYEIEKRAAP